MATSTGVKSRREVAARVLALACGLFAAPLPAGAAGCGDLPAESAIGQAAIDGDTFSTADGREWRLAGVLAPKRGDGARPPEPAKEDAGRRMDHPRGSPADAARVALDALVRRQTLWLAPMGETADRHGRRIAAAHDAACLSLAERLLTEGHVRVYPTVPTRRFAGSLYQAEASARTALRGLWSDPRYRVLQADETVGRADSYVVVEGRPAAVIALRSATVLLFGADRGRDFGVAIEAKVRKLLPPAGLEPGRLVGRQIRVRGWLRQRGDAPVIDLVVPEQLEVVEP